MAADSKKELVSLTAISANGTTLGKEITLPSDAKNLMLVSSVSAFTDGSYLSKLQFSFDGGSTWLDVKEDDDSTVWSISVGSAISDYTLLLNTVPFGTLVRGVVIASGVTTGASVKLELMFGRNR